MNNVGTMLASRYPQLTRTNNQQAASSIENTVGTTNSSIELPAEIDSLIDNKAFRNRYRKLIREGHLADLLELAELARERATEQSPSHWFAKACSVKHWEAQTMPFLARLRQVRATAERVAERLSTGVTNLLYQLIWRGVNVERWSALAVESSHAKPGQGVMQHFVWLCKHGLSGALGPDVSHVLGFPRDAAF